MKSNNNRSYGLDVLRSAAIILVFLCHYTVLTNQTVFGFIGSIGWVGVDLFFVLSGYLIGHQIFSGLIQKTFSLKIFYCRRILRTLPNYLFVLAIYFLIPDIREEPLITPIWKFLTFTQNFGLHFSAFSHAWSLCVEEQFYFVLPLIALLIAYKGSVRMAWFVIAGILLGGIILRSYLWVTYIQHAGHNVGAIYMSKIYYPTFTRLDGLTLGIAIALIKDFHQALWARITTKGNLFLLLGLLGCYLSFNELHNRLGFISAVFGYPFRSFSFAALTLAALSPNAWLYKFRIPGATTLAIWSYAIYLIHKPLIHLTLPLLARWDISSASISAAIICALISLVGGWLLYTLVETPFLKLRDKIGKIRPAFAELHDQVAANTITTLIKPIDTSSMST